jgi:hypothetical protein
MAQNGDAVFGDGMADAWNDSIEIKRFSIVKNVDPSIGHKQ